MTTKDTDILINKKVIHDLKSMLPKKFKSMYKRKKSKSLDEWKAEYTDEDWHLLAQQNKTLWHITRTTKSFSDMSWKVAVNGAFQVLSGATKRKTFVATEQEDVRLNLWNITLGYSGISRKTTTRRSIFSHLEEIDYLNYIPVKLTPEALYAELHSAYNKQEDESNAMILGDELGSFFKSLKKDYMSEMTDTLSDVYDCKKLMERSSISSKRVTVRNPYLRIYGGGTKTVIKHLTDEQFEQGFLARFHFVLDFDLEGRKLKLIGKPNAQQRKEFKKVSLSLKKIGSLSVKALLYEEIPQEFIDYQHYCNERLLSHTKRGDSITAPYYARLPFHALKIAGILYLSDLVLKEGTTHTKNVLPSEYIMLGMYFMRLYEQEYLQLVYRYKSSAPGGRFDTQEKKLAHVENLLKLEGEVTTRSNLLKKANLISQTFNPVMETLMENNTILQTKLTKELLFNYKIIKKVNGKYEKNPFMGRGSPRLVWLQESFKDDKAAIKHWVAKQREKKENK